MEQRRRRSNLKKMSLLNRLNAQLLASQQACATFVDMHPPVRSPRAGQFLSRFPALRAGFTLVEVTLSVGVLSIAMVSVMGLLPFGLSTFREAMTNTVESQIVQGISNDILLTEFDQLPGLVEKELEYDNDGRPLGVGNASGRPVYTARIVLQALDDPTKYPVSLQSAGARNEAYNVLVEIRNHTMPDHTTQYSVIVADNNL